MFVALHDTLVLVVRKTTSETRTASEADPDPYHKAPTTLSIGHCTA
jgi:hypothetical protein